MSTADVTTYENGNKPKLNRKLAIAIIEDGRREYEIAFAARMRPTQFSAIKRGVERGTENAKLRIANAMGLTVAELFDDD